MHQAGSSPTGGVFEGEGIGVGRWQLFHESIGPIMYGRRGGVQHGHSAATRRSSPTPQLRRPDHHLHLPPHRQLRRERRRRREPDGAFCRGVISPRPGPAHIQQPSAHRAHLATSCCATASPGIAGIDTRRLTRLTSATLGAMPGAFGPADRVPPSIWPPLKAESRHDRHRPRRHRSPRASRTRSDSDGAGEAVVAFDFGIKTNDPRHLGRDSEPSRSCPPTTTADDVMARGARRRVPLERARRPRDRERSGRSDPRAESSCSARFRSSASASATSCCRWPSAGTTYKLPFGHHGGNVTRCNGSARTEQGRDHRPEPQLRGRAKSRSLNADVDPRQPQRRNVCEGMAVHDEFPAFSVQYHPEAGPGPHDSTYLFDRVRRTDGHLRAKASVMPRATNRSEVSAA